MSFSSPQVESRIEFTPIPQHDHNQTLNNNNDHVQIRVNNVVNPHIVIQPMEEPFDWDFLVIMLRLALVGTLLVGFSIRETKINKPKLNLIKPRILVDKLHIPQIKIVDGELSAIWELTLTISNIMNATSLSIRRLDATISYEESEPLASEIQILRKLGIQSLVSSLDGKEMKKVHFKLNTTGWEKDQPIVDDSVIQSIAHDMQKGVSRFSLHLLVVGEVGTSDGWALPFYMHSNCNNLRVKFVGDDHKGVTGTMIDANPIECISSVEWEY